MWKFKFLVLASVALLNSSLVSARNCGTNPSTIVLRRGEKIQIEYWNPAPTLEAEATEQEPEAVEVTSEPPVVVEHLDAKSQSPLEAASLVTPAPVVDRDAETDAAPPVERTAEVVDRAGEEPPGDVESWNAAGVALTGQPAPEFEQPSTTTVEPESIESKDDDEGSGLSELITVKEVTLLDGLESSGDGLANDRDIESITDEPVSITETEAAPTDATTEAPPTREVQVLTNLVDPVASDDETMEFVIKSESLHPVKAPPIEEKVSVLQEATTEAVPVAGTEQTPGIESKFDLASDIEEGSGAPDVPDDTRQSNENTNKEEEVNEEGSGSFDGLTHSFEHEAFTISKDLESPDSQTEATTDRAIDDSPEFRNDDILISRIRTIVNSLTNARPLFRRTTGLFQSMFNRRSRRSVPKDFYRSQEFKQFLRSQPLPIRRALSPNFAGRFSRNIEGQTVLVEEECDLHIKTEPGLHLLMTFHNLSAPYTVDCAGAYVEIEREGNGFEARWCGNPIGQQRGMRSHVIFARSEVRVSVFNSPEILRQKMSDESSAGKTTRGLNDPLPPTGFTADIEVIDLHDAGQYNAFQRSQAYSTVNRLIG